MPVTDLAPLTPADTAPIEFPGKVQNTDDLTEFSDEFKRWLANFVDVFNENMSNIQSALASLDARITMLGG